MLMAIISIFMGIILLCVSNCREDDIGLIGYRTRNSVKNKANWKASNILAGSISIVGGIILFILSLVFRLDFWASFGIFIGMFILIIFITETFLYYYSKKH